MKHFKIASAFLVALIGIVSFFAFKNVKASSDESYVWIRYNCATNPTYISNPDPAGTNFQAGATLNPTGFFSSCTGAGNICAVRFLSTEVERINSSDPNNLKPKPGIVITGHQVARCQ